MYLYFYKHFFLGADFLNMAAVLIIALNLSFLLILFAVSIVYLCFIIVLFVYICWF